MNSLDETKRKLDSVSSSFCLAKWKQVTLHLGLGHTHSCHHPRTHKIPKELLEDNPSVLHNTPYKLEQRQKMLNGVRPSECQYCWACEDADSSQISDRIIKSNDEWASPYFNEVLENNPFINPSYVEVSFSNVCNFKCSYCSPQFSSKWMEEIQQHSGYDTTFEFNNEKWLDYHNRRPIPQNTPNPYVDAFWKWWPDLYPNLKVFRITGGEPLLSKDTFKVFEHIQSNPNQDLALSVNSNACVPDTLWTKMVNCVKNIEQKQGFKSFELYASIDGAGRQAEYIRHGLNYDQFKNNIEVYLKETSSLLTFMVTYNILSMFSFNELLIWVEDLKKRFGQRVKIDMSYLRNPIHQNIQLVDDRFEDYLDDCQNFLFISDHFMEWEKQKFDRIRSYKDAENKDFDANNGYKDFIIFFDEHDKRRNTNLLNTFPELEEFYNFCKEFYEKYIEFKRNKKYS